MACGIRCDWQKLLLYSKSEFYVTQSKVNKVTALVERICNAVKCDILYTLSLCHSNF